MLNTVIKAAVFLLLVGGCRQKPTTAIERLPSISLLALDGKSTFATDSVTKDRPVVLLWFDPECENCEAEVKSITENMKSLAEAQFIFLTLVPVDRVHAFVDHHKLKEFDNVVVGQDHKFAFPQLFNANAVPVTAIYSSKGILQRVITGSASYTHILNELKK